MIKSYFSILLIYIFSSFINLQAKEPRVEGGRADFRLFDCHGNPISSADDRFQSKVVYITIWGTWCPPCLSEVPTLIDLQRLYGDEGLVVVAIAFERDTSTANRRQQLRDFIEKHKINYLVLDGGTTSDFSRSLPNIVDVKGLPIEILIDRKGQVKACRNSYGYSKKWATKLEHELKQLLRIKK
jgi:thiol-disulfide isomerase/thioredoxin